jgi:hypothetical protein
MEDLMAEMKRIAKAANLEIVLPKAPSMSEEEKRIMDEFFASPNRFVDYIGNLRR